MSYGTLHPKTSVPNPTPNLPNILHLQRIRQTSGAPSSSTLAPFPPRRLPSSLPQPARSAALSSFILEHLSAARGPSRPARRGAEGRVRAAGREQRAQRERRRRAGERSMPGQPEPPPSSCRPAAAPARGKIDGNWPRLSEDRPAPAGPEIVRHEKNDRNSDRTRHGEQQDCA